MRRLFPLLILCVATTACLTDTVVVGDRCAVSLESVAPDPASVGQTVTLTGGPFTTAYDTSVYVGQRRALVLELARTSCNECDSCRDNNGCTECDDCDACDEVCASCEESLLVEVPETEPGETTVLVFNAYGATTPAALTIESEAVEDTGGADSGSTDTGPTDTGSDGTGTGDTAGEESDTAVR